MEPFILKPAFFEATNMVTFNTTAINSLMDVEYNSNFGFFQQAFNMYGYMRLNEDMKYVIHYVEGYPYLWQPHQNCAWTPLGNFEWNNLEIEPCKSMIQIENCFDENYNSIFKAFHAWSTGATVGMSGAGIKATNMFVRSVLANATEGNRLMVTAGKLFDLNTVVANTGLKTSIEQAFRKTANTCRGWMELCRTTAQTIGNGHLDQSALFIQAGGGQNISTDGTKFIGSVVALYDSLRAGAKPALRSAIINGGIGSSGRAFFPMMIVSPTIQERAYDEWLAIKSSPVVNEMRLGVQKISAANQTVQVMYIDDLVPLIPIYDVDYYDRLLTGTSHFAYVTISGTIQIGSNFANIPRIGGAEVAIAIQQKTDLDELGRTLFLSHNLSAVALKDKDFISGAYKYTVAA